MLRTTIINFVDYSNKTWNLSSKWRLMNKFFLKNVFGLKRKANKDPSDVNVPLLTNVTLYLENIQKRSEPSNNISWSHQYFTFPISK